MIYKLYRLEYNRQIFNDGIYRARVKFLYSSMDTYYRLQR